jgi:hypothetical protein
MIVFSKILPAGIISQNILHVSILNLTVAVSLQLQYYYPKLYLKVAIGYMSLSYLSTPPSVLRIQALKPYELTSSWRGCRKLGSI